MYINDYAMLREVNGVLLPGPDADVDALVQYMMDLCNPFQGCVLGGTPFISGYHDYGVILLEHLRDSLAFDPRDMDQSVLAGVPPRLLELLRGRYDPEATDRALIACSECPSPLREEHLGVPFFSWGGDLTWDLGSKLTPPLPSTSSGEAGASPYRMTTSSAPLRPLAWRR